MTCPNFYEHMFPRLRQKIGTVLLDRIDLAVGFSTLGEYALADDLLPVAIHADRQPAGPRCNGATPAFTSERPRVRDDCPLREPPLSRRLGD